VLLFDHQNAGTNYDIKTVHRSSENVEQLKYKGLTVMNHCLIQEEIKRRLNSGDAFYHSVKTESFVFSSAVYKLKD
jgi:hypothetical protein